MIYLTTIIHKRPVFFVICLEINSLKQTIIKKIRQNILLEEKVLNLDVQISLLVKNRISLEQLISSTRKSKLSNSKKTANDEYSLKGKDRETQAKIELYGRLFSFLHKNPKSFARILHSSSKQGNKKLENLVMATFGYVQGSSEEYIVLNLIEVFFL